MNQTRFPAEISALLARGQTGSAVSLARALADRSDSEALFCLATWHVIGAILPRDLSLARQFLDRAASQGHIDAARMRIAFTANGSGAQPDWSDALSHLRGLAGIDDASRQELRLIEQMHLDDRGAPTDALEGIDLEPAGIVHRYPALLTRAECDHIVATTMDYMEPALVFDPATGRQIRNPVRSADAMVVSPTREDLVLRAVSLRLAAASDTVAEQAEATTVMRYRQGQDFKLHHDSLDRTSNQRVKTVLVYLNDDFTGGETVFPHLGLTVIPRKGDAILFHNIRGGHRLAHAQHAGLPVHEGEKWLLSKWIRALPFSLWVGPESGYAR